MPSGNVDYPYIIKFILVDINNKTIDCPDKFSYQFSNSNTTFTDYDCNSNHLYINKSFPIMDEYSFIIPMMNKTYSFEINQGERYIIIKIFNCTENIGTGQNATITLPLDVKDKYNNSVPDEEINNKFKIILTDNSHNIPLFKIKENGLIKYTSIIKVANTYYWDLFYNEKKINTSKHYTTKVIAYPYFPRTTCSISLKEVLNRSKLDFYDYYSEIDIFPHDNYSNFVYSSEFKLMEVYIFNNNNSMLNLKCADRNYFYICYYNYTLLTSNSFLFFKAEGNNDTATFLYEVDLK